MVNQNLNKSVTSTQKTVWAIVLKILSVIHSPLKNQLYDLYIKNLVH